MTPEYRLIGGPCDGLTYESIPCSPFHMPLPDVTTVAYGVDIFPEHRVAVYVRDPKDPYRFIYEGMRA